MENNKKKHVIIVNYSNINDANNSMQANKNSAVNNKASYTSKVATTILNVREHFEYDKKQFAVTKKIKKINKYEYTFPFFYKSELLISFISFISWVFIFFLSLIGMSLAIWQICTNPSVSPWILVLLIPGFIVILSTAIVNFDKFYIFRGEARSINFYEQKTPSNNTVKIYKKIKTSFVNINWIAASFYVSSFLIYLLTSLAINFDGNINSSFMKFWTYLDFNIVAIEHNYTYFIVCLICVITFFLTILLQASLIVLNMFRIARIENYYGANIVSYEELAAIKKYKFKRNLIIFLIASGLIAYICYLFYRIFKKRRTRIEIVK